MEGSGSVPLLTDPDPEHWFSAIYELEFGSCYSHTINWLADWNGCVPRVMVVFFHYLSKMDDSLSFMDRMSLPVRYSRTPRKRKWFPTRVLESTSIFWSLKVLQFLQLLPCCSIILTQLHIPSFYIVDPNPDPLVRGLDPRIRIRIHAKLSWIRNTVFCNSFPVAALAWPSCTSPPATSWIRIRIHWSEAWIRESGSGSTPKCHGSATLFFATPSLLQHYPDPAAHPLLLHRGSESGSISQRLGSPDPDPDPR